MYAALVTAVAFNTSICVPEMLVASEGWLCSTQTLTDLSAYLFVYDIQILDI